MADEKDLAIQQLGPIAGNRWVQLAAGVVAMIVISNFQYAFTLFTPGLKEQFARCPTRKLRSSIPCSSCLRPGRCRWPDISSTNSASANSCSWGQSCILLGWLLGGTVATTVFHHYISYGAIAGTGAGIIYIATVANAVKWFPDKRGLAAGLHGRGIRRRLRAHTHPHFRHHQQHGLAGCHDRLGHRPGYRGHRLRPRFISPPHRLAASRTGCSPRRLRRRGSNLPATEMLSTKEFYIMYFMFLMVCTGGLMTTGNLSQIAKSLNVFDAKIMGIAIVPFVATIAGCDERLCPDHVGIDFRPVRAGVHDGLRLRP